MTLVHLIENDIDLPKCAIYYWAQWVNRGQ
jgi:hypothetical protein